MFHLTSVIKLILRIIFVYSFTLNFLILLFPIFCNKLILSPVYSFFPTFCNKRILSLTIFCFQVLGLFRTFHTHHDAQRPPHDFSFWSFGFVLEFWVCFKHSAHTPRCLTPAPCFFVSEFWVCFEHSTHTTMLNAHLTIFRFGVLGLFQTFRTHTPRCSTPTPRFFISEFWVSCRVLVLFGLIPPDVLRKN